MTMESMGALILQRVNDIKNNEGTSHVIEELRQQGYNPLQIARYLSDMAYYQVKRDIIPITVAETVAYTGESIETVSKLMINHLKGVEL